MSPGYFYSDGPSVTLSPGEWPLPTGTPSCPPPGSVCPTCDRRVPVPRENHTPRRRAQLAISVPKDAEDGEEILRTLLDTARERLVESGAFAYDRECPVYFVLVAVLHSWLTGGADV